MTPFPAARRGRLPLSMGLAALVATLALTLSPVARAKSDAPTTVPGDLLVKLSSGDLLPALQLKFRLSLVDRLGARPIFRLRVGAGVSVSQVAGALALEPGVLVAEANALHAGPEAAKNNVWAIGTAQAYQQQWAPAAIRLAPAQAITGGAGVRVAVLDTGVDASHPLLAGRLLPGRDFVDGDLDPSETGSRADAAFGHGTHVAGLVALAAPAARIMPVRVLDASGTGDAWSLAAAMLWAVDPDGNPATDDGAHVINLSLAGSLRTRLLDNVALLAGCLAPDPTVASDDLSDPGYEDDRRRCSGFGGALVVAAAGNDGSRSVKAYPAAEGAYGLISVTASASDGRLAGFSNSGSWVQIAAPGVGLTSSVPGGWGTWSGTSMAAPLVSGVAALLRSQTPSLNAADLVRCLSRTGRSLDNTSIRQLDAQAALQAVGNRSLCR